MVTTIQIILPVPMTQLQLFLLLMGALIGRAFGKKLDQDIQNTKRFKDLPSEWRGILRRILDFTHHWWIGVSLMFYGPSYLSRYKAELYWIGAGLFCDDVRDYKNLYRRFETYPGL